MALHELMNEIKLYGDKNLWYAPEDIVLDKQAIETFKANDVETTIQNYEKSLRRVEEKFYYSSKRHAIISDEEARTQLIRVLRYGMVYPTDLMSLEDAESFAKKIFQEMGENSQIFVGNSILGATFEFNLVFVSDETIGLIAIGDED